MVYKAVQITKKAGVFDGAACLYAAKYFYGLYVQMYRLFIKESGGDGRIAVRIIYNGRQNVDRCLPQGGNARCGDTR